MGINEAINLLKKVRPNSRVKGYWKVKNGFVIQTFPEYADNDWLEECLFFIGDNGTVEVTTPIKHMEIMSKKITKIK